MLMARNVPVSTKAVYDLLTVVIPHSNVPDSSVPSSETNHPPTVGTPGSNDLPKVTMPRQ